MKRIFLTVFLNLHLLTVVALKAQTTLAAEEKVAPTPPMGWMSGNHFGENIHEKTLREMADALVSSGMAGAGYQYLFVDDGWQGGRDKQNHIIADPAKFPSGIKALADYVHSKGLKLGLYSDAAQLSCGGYTASLNFEEQDAKTFAGWGVDYLKYEYCGAPVDSATAVSRYSKMGDALRKSGRDISYAICEWGGRKPWHWAAQAGAQLWRISPDVQDKWQNQHRENRPEDLQTVGAGILDIADINSPLHQYAAPGRWNDAGMLVIGLSAKEGPSADVGATGCTEAEYQSQMSLWSMMASPLAPGNDIRKMNLVTKRILMNEEIIAVNQDALGRQAERMINNEDWSVFVKPLSNGDYAVAILNRSDKVKNYSIRWADLGLTDQFVIRDVWRQQLIAKGRRWKGKVLSHETRVFRLKKV